MDSDFIHISHYEVTTAVTKLNNKKSGDEFGINAEHFKLAGQSIIATLVELFNAILEHSYIPPQFLSGIITPVYKKRRDATDLSNYRVITVSCTLGNILEHVILNRIEHLLRHNSHHYNLVSPKERLYFLQHLLLTDL